MAALMRTDTKPSGNTHIDSIMHTFSTSTRGEDPGHVGSARKALSCFFLAMSVGFTAPAHAVDGCKVLLCFAAPSWRAIPQCVPPIEEVLRDLARGRAFPTCAMSGPTNSASHVWASAPTYCPPQYTRMYEAESGPVYSCEYAGAVSVNIDGALWARTWWNLAGDTSTEFGPAAKARLGAWDTKFATDFAAWLTSQPPVEPPCTSC